jgi:hypothetical protein
MTNDREPFSTTSLRRVALALCLVLGGGWTSVNAQTTTTDIIQGIQDAVSDASTWTQLPGAGMDIGVGANGSLWVLGTKAVDGGYEIYRWNGSGWTQVQGGAVRIDVAPDGNAWVVNSTGQIHRYNGSGWTLMPGAAKDIGIGAKGDVWVIGTDAVPGGFGIYRWSGSAWTKTRGGAVRIDVDPHGYAWIVNSTGQISRGYIGSLGPDWSLMPGAAKDIGIGGDGSVFVVGTDNGVYKWSGSGWVKRDGALTDITVDQNGVPWGVNAANQLWKGYK